MLYEHQLMRDKLVYQIDAGKPKQQNRIKQ